VKGFSNTPSNIALFFFCASLIYFYLSKKAFYIEIVYNIYQIAYLQDLILNGFRLKGLKCAEEEESTLFIFFTEE